MSGTVSETILQEGGLLCYSFLFGIALMMLYDILRIFRHIVKHRTILLAVEDALYWIICGIGIFAMLYRENDGLLRWFVLVGVAIGMLVENGLFSPWIIRFFVKIIRFSLKVGGKVAGAAARPGKKLFLFFRKELKKLRKVIKIGLDKQ